MSSLPPLKTGVATRIEYSFSIAVLAVMALLPLVEIAGRKLAGQGIPGSIPIVQHLTLWIAFLGAALAAGSGRLLALSTPAFMPARWQLPIRIFTAAVAVGITFCLVIASIDLVSSEREAANTVALGIPVWVAVSIMPAALAVIAGRLIWHAAEHWPGRLLAASGLALPVILGLAPSLQEANLLLPGSLLIVAATALGMPIYAALGGAALLFFWNEMVPLAAVPVESYRLSASPMLPAIPLFTLAGFILTEGGATRRLLRAFTALFGWMPGGLAIVTVVALAFFTPLTGASGVTILSLGGVLMGVLTQARYNEKSSLGLVTVSGSIGLLFPPSLPVILYGVYAHTPIDRLFIGALLPGVLLVVVVAAGGAWQGWRAGAQRTPFQAGEAAAALWEAKLDLLLPVVILVGIFGGFATLVEASALAALYAFVVECFIYKNLGIRRDMPRVMIETATMVGAFLIILGMALGFTNFLIYAEVPMQALHWVRANIDSPIVFLLALNVFLLIVGALMDIYSAIFVVVPLITPMGAAYGIDPVHLGIIFLANMELGYLMPPMGENLFLASSRFNQSLTRVYVSTLPFMLILLGAVLLITYMPAMTLGLVNIFDR